MMLFKVVMFFIFVILLLVYPCKMETVDEIKYSKMPKLFTMDDFDDCFLTDGYYCNVDIHLKSTKPSDLWYQIKNFSANTMQHFRHDILHRGICVTRSCNTTMTYQDLESNNETLHKILTEYVNRQLTEKYNLEGDVFINYCEKKNERVHMDVSDWIFLVIILCLVLVNTTGSLYHWRCIKNEEKQSIGALVAFSVISNWKKLMTKAKKRLGNAEDNEKMHLSCMHGIRFLTMILVICSHAPIVIINGYMKNPIVLESNYDNIFVQTVFNANVIVQTFFCMASFLMAYHFLIYIEKHKRVNIKSYFFLLSQRWLRLTPVYAVVLGFACTLYRRMGSGPQWQQIVSNEADTCRQNWWINLLYLNNYIINKHTCFIQSWYLAADTQLFLYGALIMTLIWKYPNIKKVLFGILMIVAVLLPGILTFKNKYTALIDYSPESLRTMYIDNSTFIHMYITVQGNLGGYTVGLIAGCLQYYFEKNNISLKKTKWCYILYLLILPLSTAVVLSGVIFSKDDHKCNPLSAAVYAALNKTLYGTLIACFLLGTIHKCDNIIRNIIEWEGFHILGRLTYCAYLVHTIPQRLFIGSIRQPFEATGYGVVAMCVLSVTITYFISWMLCILVEMPFCKIQKMLFKIKEKDEDEIEIKTIDINGEITKLNVKTISKHNFTIL